MQKLLLFILLVGGFMTTSCNTSKTAATQRSTATQQTRQQGVPRQGGPDIDAMVEQLGLTEAQATSFKKINERYVAKFRELRQSAGDDRQAMRTQMESLRSSQTKEVNAILDKGQQETYAKLQAEMEEQRRSRGPGGGRPGDDRPSGGVQ